MKKRILFEGKITLAGQLVNFRIYKNEGEDIIPHFSFEVNPEVKEEGKDYHRGGIQRAKSLEELLFQFNEYQKEFTKIDAMRFNTEY